MWFQQVCAKLESGGELTCSKMKSELNLPQKFDLNNTTSTVESSKWTKINQVHKKDHKPELQ